MCPSVRSRGGIYESTDYVDRQGNPLYKNNGKLYSLNTNKEYVSRQERLKTLTSGDLKTNSTEMSSELGQTIEMDGHKIYTSGFPPISSNPFMQYRFSDPNYRSTGGDVYFGENIATSYFEVRNNVESKSLFVGEISVDNMLDLTDKSAMKKLGIDPKRLIMRVDNPAQQKSIYEYTNKISNQAFEAGYNGIIYPSSRKDGNNKAVVLFEGRYNPEEIKTIINRPLSRDFNDE